jgi:hypothetical protein
LLVRGAKEAISLFDDFCSGRSKEGLSLDPAIDRESLRLLLRNGLSVRFPEVIKSHKEELQRIKEEQKIERNEIEGNFSIWLEERMRKVEGLQRHFLLKRVLSAYPYVSPFMFRFPH